jgi:hypothetical protein
MRSAFVLCFSKNHFEHCSLVFFDLNKLHKQSPPRYALSTNPTQHVPRRPLISLPSSYFSSNETWVKPVLGIGINYDSDTWNQVSYDPPYMMVCFMGSRGQWEPFSVGSMLRRGGSLSYSPIGCFFWWQRWLYSSHEPSRRLGSCSVGNTTNHRCRSRWCRVDIPYSLSSHPARRVDIAALPL